MGPNRASDLGVGLAQLANGVTQNLSASRVRDYRGSAVRLGVDDGDVATSLGAEHFDVLPDQGKVHDLLLGGGLLDDYLGLLDCRLVNIGHLDF